jgi:hypothetical protein
MGFQFAYSEAALLAAIGSAARQLSFAFRKGGRGSFLPN